MPELAPIPEEFLMTKRKVNVINYVKETPCDQLMSHYSSLCQLKRAVAWLLRFKEILLSKANPMRERKNFGDLSVNELESAEFCIVKNVQEQFYPEVLKHRAKTRVTQLPKGSKLKRLNPFLLNSVMHVGGILKRSSLDFEQKHPIILPPNHRFTTLLIEHYHCRYGHAGMGKT